MFNLIRPLRHTDLLPGTLQNLFYPPEDYIYFKRAGELPFTSDDPIAKAAWSADASMLAYARYGVRRMDDAELKANFDRAGLAFEKIGGTPGNWNAPGTQAVFAGCDQFAILAFRGTEADDPDDVLYDGDLALVHEPDYRPVPGDPKPALGHFASVMQLFSAPCFVHRGFQQALCPVWDQVHQLVRDYRSKYPTAEIRFTGHSLGGALAVLAYSRFDDSNLSLCTFGCPRVGDGAFRDRVISNPGKGIYRIVNFNDAVAHVPLESLLYKQSPVQCYRFAENGNLGPDGDAFSGDVNALCAAVYGLPASLRCANLDRIPAPPSLVDHSPARYCYRMWDCV